MGMIIVSPWVLIGGLLGGAAAACAVISLAHADDKRGGGAGFSDRANTSAAFSGNLIHTTLLDAIQFLEIGQREGVLHIYSGRRKGYLALHRGQLVDGFYRNDIGRAAVLHMLTINEGDFYFEPRRITQPRLIAGSLADIAYGRNAQ